MPLTIKTSVMSYKDPTSGNYVPINAVGDTTSEMIAPFYDELTFPVAEGTPCVHEGTLYRASQTISTIETWTAAHWLAVANVMSEVDTIKSQISEIEDDIGTVPTGKNLQGEVDDIGADVGALDGTVYGRKPIDVVAEKSITNGTSGGITYSVNNDTRVVTANGTRSGTSFRTFAYKSTTQFPDGFVAGGTYRIEFESSYSCLGIYIIYYVSGSESGSVIIKNNSVFTIPSDKQSLEMSIRALSGWDGNRTETITLPKIYRVSDDSLVARAVTDVRVNGVSVLNQGVANVPLASENNVGAIAVGSGIAINSGNGKVSINSANLGTVKSGTHLYMPIVPGNQHQSTFYGLAKAAGADMVSVSGATVGVYPEAQRSAISQMLDAPETVSGSTPSITAKPGVRYICGEVSTLTITVPASGCIDVVFTSGSTATVLTVTPTKTGVTAVKWANGFDPTALEANTRYEVIIDDGEWGMACAWT